MHTSYSMPSNLGLRHSSTIYIKANWFSSHVSRRPFESLYFCPTIYRPSVNVKVTPPTSTWLLVSSLIAQRRLSKRALPTRRAPFGMASTPLLARLSISPHLANRLMYLGVVFLPPFLPASNEKKSILTQLLLNFLCSITQSLSKHTDLLTLTKMFIDLTH